MATDYKVLGQVATSQSSLTVTNKELTSNVATLTTSAAHNLQVGSQVSVILSPADSSFDGVHTVVSAPTTTTFTFESINSDVTSASSGGSVTGFEWETLYTCPSATATVVSSLVICNRGNSAGYYKVALDTTNSGEPANSKILVFNDLAAAKETVALTIGLTLDATNKYLRVAASNDDFTFALFGSEIS
ncbi:MAG: hypothetical protein CBC03_09255 [Pseudoalteromonas sp. TMED43]|nr:MAG: hypothetical protein CBC03_09255 [Pseudoalteromonas sp. TMED43]